MNDCAISETINILSGWISDAFRAKNECNIFLTGGRTASRLYHAWRLEPNFSMVLSGVSFYFGDERCVPSQDPESNYNLATKGLFPSGVPEGVHFHRMICSESDLNSDQMASYYADILPESIDIILLSVGDDGHIASLFPHSTALNETDKSVLLIRGPKPPYERMTITPPVICAAQHVVVMALGSHKRMVYEQLHHNPSDIAALPARLVLDRTWVFGE